MFLRRGRVGAFDPPRDIRSGGEHRIIIEDFRRHPDSGCNYGHVFWLKPTVISNKKTNNTRKNYYGHTMGIQGF